MTAQHAHAHAPLSNAEVALVIDTGARFLGSPNPSDHALGRDLLKLAVDLSDREADVDQLVAEFRAAWLDRLDVVDKLADTLA